MCGIAGIAALDESLGPDARTIARSMGETLRHRGPDSSGTWSDNRVALAHRRLAILDLSDRGAQPMLSSSGRYVTVFNGEIYNHRELASRLRKTGWRNRGSSDTEVLLAAIEAWGFDYFLEQADGMFALALYDRTAGRLLLARDRFGEKPLAYCWRDRRFYFASEVRAFTRVPALDLSLDAGATGDYFRFGYLPAASTIYADIAKVCPGTVVEVDLSGQPPLTRRYWTAPAYPEVPVSAGQDRDEELLDILSASVRNRLVSDRPIGAFLSGGIDSSVVCALAARHTTGALKTFTMGWEDAEYDESVQAAKVASAIGADHHDVRLNRADVVKAVQRLGVVMDEPFADSSQLAVLLVATQARSHVVVALSGDGGDELFAGYNRHKWLIATRRFQRIGPASVRRMVGAWGRRAAPLIEAMLTPIPPTRRPRLVADKVRKLAGVLSSPSIPDAYQLLLAYETSIGSPRPLPAHTAGAMNSQDADTVLWALRVADLEGWLPDDVLTKVDRATMAVSLESRTPFLQGDLVKASLHLGTTSLRDPSGPKKPLRSLLSRLLPSVPFNQPKTGFGVPIASLLRDELSPVLGDAISTYRARGFSLGIDWDAQWNDLKAGADAPAPLLWTLLMFELWAAEVPHGLSWR